MTRQLDLFVTRAGAPRPANTASIVIFPVCCRVKLIRQTAALLRTRKTKEGQQAAWSKALAKLTAELERHGASSSEIRAHLTQFHQAVGDEFARDHHQHQRPHPAS